METTSSLAGPFSPAGLSGPEHMLKMEGREDFADDSECHSNNSQEPEEQDSMSGEPWGGRRSGVGGGRFGTG